MSQFTRLLRDIVVEREGIGLDRYPIFNEDYRPTLNDKIVTHYYMREIGFENDDYFIFALRRKMNEIMPFYNKLYKTELIEYDPLKTIDIKTLGSATGTRDTDSASTADTVSTTGSSARSVNSTTPQTLLDDNGQYATGISDSNSKTSTDQDVKNSGTSNEKSLQSTTGETVGQNQSVPSIINEVRSILLNIDMMVINELEELFMTVWGSSDNQNSTAPMIPYGYPVFPARPFI